MIIGADLDIARKMRERISAIHQNFAGQLIEGEAQDWPHYRYMCGFLEGLTAALQEVNELERQILGE